MGGCTMTNQQKLIQLFGNPLQSPIDRELFEKQHMMVLFYPADIRMKIPALGKSVYCNKLIENPLVASLRELIKRNLHGEIKENDQCFLPRYQRGSTTQISIHTWALAVDFNPTQNPIYKTRQECIDAGLTPFTPEFIQTWRDMGWVVGEDFPGRPDLMHVEWTKFLNETKNPQ